MKNLYPLLIILFFSRCTYNSLTEIPHEVASDEVVYLYPFRRVSDRGIPIAVGTTYRVRNRKGLTWNRARYGTRLGWVYKVKYRELNPIIRNYTPPSRTIYTGPRGGRYYINSNGNKTYIKH